MKLSTKSKIVRNNKFIDSVMIIDGTISKKESNKLRKDARKKNYIYSGMTAKGHYVYTKVKK